MNLLVPGEIAAQMLIPDVRRHIGKSLSPRPSPDWGMGRECAGEGGESKEGRVWWNIRLTLKLASS